MTEISEPAKQMAADLANAEMVRLDLMPTWEAASFDPSKGASAFSVTIARLCARFIAMQEDMGHIDRLCRGTTTIKEIATIAARYRVEADPLERLARDTIEPIWSNGTPSREDVIAAVFSALKRGLELGAAK